MGDHNIHEGRLKEGGKLKREAPERVYEGCGEEGSGKAHFRMSSNEWV